MKRKPTFSPDIGSISSMSPEEDPIGDLAYTLRYLLKVCRVPVEVRKAHKALLYTVLLAIAEERELDTIYVTKLCDALEHYAPPYTTFGTRENDQGETEYGFWPNLDDEMIPRVNSHDEVDQRAFYGAHEVLLVNERGNIECGRFDKRGRWHEYWSAV